MLHLDKIVAIPRTPPPPPHAHTASPNTTSRYIWRLRILPRLEVLLYVLESVRLRLEVADVHSIIGKLARRLVSRVGLREKSSGTANGWHGLRHGQERSA